MSGVQGHLDEAGPPPANGAGSTALPPPTEHDAIRNDQASRLAVALSGIVTVMMNEPAFQNYSICDLRWLVMPALATGQYSLAQARSKATGEVRPIGVVLWARVSDAVDARLRASDSARVRLQPDEWQSGPHHWVVEGIGERGVLANQIRRLRGRDWAGKPVKIKLRGHDGKPIVRTIAAA